MVYLLRLLRFCQPCCCCRLGGKIDTTLRKNLFYGNQNVC